MATKWDTVRDEWLLYVEAQYAAAEEATRGNLLSRSRRDEFGKKYGWRAVAQMLFSDLHAAGAYYYASEELVDWWRAHPRLTWNEFAVQNGIRYRHVVRAALKAPGSRAAAEYRASCGRRRGGLARTGFAA